MIVATTNRNPRPARSSTTRRSTDGRTPQRKKKKKSAAQATSDREVQGLLLMAFGVLSALALYTGTTGPVGDVIASVTGWMVGQVRYVVPLGLLWLGYHRLRTAPAPRRTRKKKTARFEPAQLGAGALLVAALFSALDLFGGRPWNGATVEELSSAGGQVGVRIGGTLETLVGHWGHILLTITMVLVAATVLTSISAGWVLEAIIDRLRSAAGYVADSVSNLNIDTSRLGWKRSGGAPQVQSDIDPLMDIEITTADSGSGLKKSKEAKDKYIDLRGEETGEFDDLPPAPLNPLDELDPTTDAENTPNGEAAPTRSRAKKAADATEATPAPSGFAEPPTEVAVSRYQPIKPPEEVAIAAPSPEGGEWLLPSLGTLDLSDTQDVDETEVRERGMRLQRALQEHGVETRLIGVRVGPTISMFEYELAPKTKVAKVTSLKGDIAYAMATPDVRILAPIPGKQAIGVEVPNVTRSLVTVGDLLVSEEAAAATHPLEVGLGRDINGRTIMINLAKMPHLLVAGQTGSGKSSGINTMLTSILMRSTPEQVRMILIDPKRVELTQYNGLPHLLSEVVTDPKKAGNALNWAVREMERRYDTLEEVGVRDITGYNQAVEDGRFAPKVMPDGSLGEYEKLSFVLIVVDELADLMMQVGAEIEEAIVRIAQKARAVGIHLIIATQRPSTNIITGLIKANVPARLAFAVSSLTDSRVILDAGGAENLVGRGDGLINDGTTSELTRFQGAWVTEEEVSGVVDFWRNQSPAVNFDPRVQGDETDFSSVGLVGGTTGSADDDEMLLAAMDLIVSSQRAAVSDMQRKLRIGFARAGRLMDELEIRGIVGPNVGSKTRDVLVTHESLGQMRVAEQAAAAPEQAPPQQQHLIQPSFESKPEPKPTLASIQNPVESDGRSKALPRPLTDTEKSELEEPASDAGKVEASKAEIPLAAAGAERDIVDHAAELIINSQLGSVPMLQRKLRVELKEAERVMNVLEERGIVGPAQGVRAREVLVKPDDETSTTDSVAAKAAASPVVTTPTSTSPSPTKTTPSDLTEELDLTDRPLDLTDELSADAGTEDESVVVEDSADNGAADNGAADNEAADDDYADEDDEFSTDEFDPALAPPPGYPKQ